MLGTVDVQLEHGESLIKALDGVVGQLKVVAAPGAEFIPDRLRDRDVLVTGVAGQHALQPTRPTLGKSCNEEKGMGILF